MQKPFLILLFSLFTIAASSQVFRVGTGIGVSVNPKRVGANINLIELGLAPTPQLETGVYFGLAANSKRKLTSVNASADLRYGLQGKYYFKETGFKPYAAVQIGLLSGITGNAAFFGSENGIKKGTRFQVAPLLGFRVGPLNANVAYQQGIKINLGLLFGFGDFE